MKKHWMAGMIVVVLLGMGCQVLNLPGGFGRGSIDEAEVQAGEALTLSLSGWTVQIPAGALQAGGVVKLAAVEPEGAAGGYQLPDGAMALSAPGSVFADLVTMTIPYDRGLLPAGMPEANVFAVHRQQGEWVRVRSQVQEGEEVIVVRTLRDGAWSWGYDPEGEMESGLRSYLAEIGEQAEVLEQAREELARREGVLRTVWAELLGEADGIEVVEDAGGLVGRSMTAAILLDDMEAMIMGLGSRAALLTLGEDVVAVVAAAIAPEGGLEVEGEAASSTGVAQLVSSLEQVREMAVVVDALEHPERTSYSEDEVEYLEGWVEVQGEEVGLGQEVDWTISGVEEEVSAAEPEPGATRVREIDGMVEVYVPAGTFLMGSTTEDPDASDDEFPQHEVTLDGYWIDQTEVTNGQYEQCVAAGACTSASVYMNIYSSSYYGDPAYADYPVALDRAEAESYCEWAGGRLPTEAEWEKAARGEDGRIYPWGNENPTCSLANFGDCYNDYDGPAPVGSFPDGASPYGVLDMAGNVWEYVADWYDGEYYNDSPKENPMGPESGDFRVERGGSFIHSSYNLRAALRRMIWPAGARDIPMDFYGFRCVRSAEMVQVPASAQDPASPLPGQIAYVGEDGDLYFYQGDTGERIQLTEDADWHSYRSPRFSPEGDRLAFLKSDPERGEYAFDLYVMDLANREVDLLAPEADDFSWHPNGQVIAFGYSVSANCVDPEQEETRGVWQVDLVTGERSELVPPSSPNVPVGSPHYASDGSWLLLESYLCFTGGNIWQYLYNPTEEGWFCPGGDWSPTGLTAACGDPVWQDGTGALLLVTPGTAESVELYRHPEDEVGQPHWSHDGDRIAMTSGTAVKDFFYSEEDYPDYHSSLVILTLEDGQVLEVCRSSGLEAFCGFTAWAPDSSLLLYTYGSYSDSDLFVFDLAAGESMNLDGFGSGDLDWIAGAAVRLE